MHLFTEIPSIQALTCKPTGKSANARISVDTNAPMQSYDILGSPVAEAAPWLDPFVRYNSPSFNKCYSKPFMSSNVSTSDSSRACQKVGETLSDLGPRWTWNGSSAPIGIVPATVYYPVLETNTPVVAEFTWKIEVLRLNGLEV
ncbi:hypothetical protein BCR34DRAFT_594048 [Clohesyomyces aquaticus]|uniref:Uncharacterized protein n=1 Tax=Clohesyomyces aquaticus TaxID=1231657 RepID=A0A1Y1YCW6_9PLEO|nr:hypothetical protein BCR34DRAFT_594048 [Clohesyomyces aquaticus]